MRCNFNAYSLLTNQDVRAKDYETHFLKFAELLEYLEKNLFGAVEDVIYSNPVKDFLINPIEDIDENIILMVVTL
ncbi:MAG: hypothetical protein WC151_06340 [Bacteroidales bacterium]|nr:hypothetical protein [Candidatus Cloacimonadota bacterium]